MLATCCKVAEMSEESRSIESQKHQQYQYFRWWRREWDSNPRYGFPYTRFPSGRLQPLGHPSGSALLTRHGVFFKAEVTNEEIERNHLVCPRCASNAVGYTLIRQYGPRNFITAPE